MVNRTKHTKRTKRKQKRTRRGGTILPSATTIILPTWRPHPYMNTLTRVRGLELYGTSLPDFNELACYRTLAFYMYRKEIRRLISIQACSAGWNANNCPAGYLDIEDQTWLKLKLLDRNTRLDPNYTFINAPMGDMTAGIINTWIQCNNRSYDTPANRSIFHCYAGLGRTGAMLFMLSFKRKFMPVQNPGQPPIWNPNYFTRPFFGQVNSRGMYNLLVEHLNNWIHLSEDPDNAPFQPSINRFVSSPPQGPGVAPVLPIHGFHSIPELRDEVFAIDTPFKARILIQRVNRWLMCWVLSLNPPPGYQMLLYPCPGPGAGPPGGYNVDNIFQAGQLQDVVTSTADAMALQQFYGNPNENMQQNI